VLLLFASAANSSLVSLVLRNNMLEGDATAVERCANLVQLDISSNGFTGRLPASAGWGDLTSYRACCNELTGSFPIALAQSAHILQTLDVSSNQLTGQIPPQITLLANLKSLNLGSNKFVGTFNENLFYLPGLLLLDVSDNGFVGTIPVSVG
jgi:Leucine-rich repeat (LRR) protein